MKNIKNTCKGNKHQEHLSTHLNFIKISDFFLRNTTKKSYKYAGYSGSLLPLLKEKKRQAGA